MSKITWWHRINITGGRKLSLPRRKHCRLWTKQSKTTDRLIWQLSWNRYMYVFALTKMELDIFYFQSVRLAMPCELAGSGHHAFNEVVSNLQQHLSKRNSASVRMVEVTNTLLQKVILLTIQGTDRAFLGPLPPPPKRKIRRNKMAHFNQGEV